VAGRPDNAKRCAEEGREGFSEMNYGYVSMFGMTCTLAFLMGYELSGSICA